MRAVSAALVVLACGAALADDAPAVRFEHDMVVRMHMHESYDLVRAMERLLLRGRLDEARDFARAIAQAPDDPGSAAFATQSARVRERAAALADATTVADAVHREARLASACASCHADAGVLPDFASPPPVPPDRRDLVARMARHVWAADRMWEGMVGLADDSWRAGLDVLAAAPLSAAELGAGRAPLAQDLRRAAERARKLRPPGAAATVLERGDDRAAAYGDILATCAACHATR